MSTAGINFSGLGSGIDTESIISQLIKVDQRPMQVLQQKAQNIQQQQTALGQVSGALSALQAAAGALTGLNSFSGVAAATSDPTIATVTAQSGAAAGSHTLQITQLAQADKVGSVAQPSQTNAMGVSGQIVINGKAINVAATDSLQALSSNINAAKVGVNASIVMTAPNSYTLVLASANTGTANKMSLSDAAGGSILSTTLGLIGGAQTVQHAITNGAASDRFADSSTSVGTLLGLTAPQAGTIQINGTGVAVDFATDSLTSIAGKINSAGISGVSAAVVATTDPVSGASRQQLQITGATTPTFTDSNSILANLGVVQSARTTQLAQAKDALFSVDGLNMTRSANTVSDALTGATINLLSDTNSPTTQITMTADTDTIKKNIQGFVSAYNQLVSTVGNLSTYDSSTGATGPLFGDVNVENTLDSVTDMLTGAVPGLKGTSTLADLGITLDQTGTLNIDDSTLSSALSSNLAGVAAIFRATATATDSGITYISSTEKTQASANAPYAVNITKVATQATTTAGTAHTADDNPDSETLTFTGAQFGSSGHTLVLNPNSTLSGIVSQINADSLLSSLISASANGNSLVLTSKLYGSAQNFSVVSSQAAAANNSGIGESPVSATGIDVAGTINGEAATGNGQFLTGTTGNKTTSGLQIRVTSAMPGDHGTISFTQGLAAQFSYFANDATDALTGTLTLYSNSLGDEVTDIKAQITDMQSRLDDETTRLRQQFGAMDSAVATMKSAANGLAALGITISSSSSSSK